MDQLYMRRCLQLAANGRQNAKPNPMVGAVIVAADGRIIGEGYHVRCGEGHAEVNAFASVRPEDEALLPGATIYVSLEPCSHYGKTPPCADLIIKKGVRRCVVGCVDPFAAVQGRGIQNEKRRPYIILKWAQTANAFLDDNGKACAISTPFTKMLVHKLRAENDAILVGRVTDEREHPQLDVRHWAGKSPRRIVIDRNRPAFDGLDFSKPIIPQLLEWLHQEKCQSLIVEGGARTLQSFIETDAWDEIRVETAPFCVSGGTAAPELPNNVRLVRHEVYDHNTIATYHRR